MQANDDGKIIWIALALGLIAMVFCLFDYFSNSRVLESDFVKADEVVGGGITTDRDEFYILIADKEYRTGRGVYSELPSEGRAVFLLSDFSNYIYQVEYSGTQYNSIQHWLMGLVLLILIVSGIFYFLGSAIFGWVLGGTGVYFLSVFISIFIFN